ncbi:arabinose efflux permease family protein [Frankia sp. EI5c]|uniref:MFS transporter n=1 Tax=Frankia sp. EI5c TaxID=683316 RepID=UPI0007C3D93D|nr:MFS transporter [Frankia sp. EI5c]OAA18109.1 arabinose efflux permease family protein [Frankia sp. EI5c]
MGETTATFRQVRDDPRRLRAVTLFLAVACGLAVANLYYSQPILSQLAAAFGTSQGETALVVTVTQIGYALGLLLIVPLGDLVANRRLAVCLVSGAAIALVAAGVAPSLSVFMVAALVVGTTSTVAQVLVPFAAHLAPPGREGAVVGRVMSGLLLGILLARTTSSLVAAALSWRWVYGLSAALMIVVVLTAMKVLPERRPAAGPNYPALIASLLDLLRHEPVLRRRAIYQTLMFGAFSAFWTSIAYELHERHHLSQVAIGLFALVGAGGAAAAPLAGRLGDQGRTRVATGAGLLLATGSMLLALVADRSVIALAVAGLLLDFGVQTTMILGQREIYTTRPESRARMNAVYLASMFAGGAIGSALAGAIYQAHGWSGVAIFAALLPLVAFAHWLWPRAAREAPVGPTSQVAE